MKTLAACVGLSLIAALSTTSAADAIVRKLEARYRGAHTLKAAFYERYADGNGGVSAESGTVYFSRPGRMRWEYESPEQKLFLVDATNAWFYVPADKTVSRAPVKDSSDWRTPLALLTGKADLARLCRTIDLVDNSKAQNASDKPLASENSVLRCFPRTDLADAPDAQTHEILLESDPEGRLTRLVIRAPGNLETEFRFGKWEENIAIPEVKFHFLPPVGVAVVDEESLASSIH
jgi:outer membrane lipoprotein carrier protein